MKQTRPTMRFLSVLAAAALLRANGESTAVGAERNPLRVRASEAFGPCLVPALEAFSAESGLPTMLDLNEPDPPGEADVVVGDDSELTRVLEGGAADLASAFDLGYLPWVYVVPEASPAQPLSALGASRRLLVLGGRAGRRAREAVALPADRVRVSTDRDVLRQAEYALVPRSLAGPVSCVRPEYGRSSPPSPRSGMPLIRPRPASSWLFFGARAAAPWCRRAWSTRRRRA